MDLPSFQPFLSLFLLLVTRGICEECPSLAKTCKECIVIPACAWCGNETYEKPRCATVEDLTESGCEDYENPMTSFESPKNENLTDGTYLNEDDEEPVSPAIQIQPQEIRLKLRQGETKRFTVKVRQSQNYPVDLYYLMDLSYSMSDDLTNLKSLAQHIGDIMRRITRRARLGFGSFVDKPVLPYINVTESVIDEPCRGCEKTYNFRNVLPLSNDPDAFSGRIQNVSVSGNLDKAEGTLDAIMQVAACSEQIGWRQNARRLLMVTTDATSHIQGDGKTAGIFTPNDGECRLEDSEYKKSHLYDYPSIGSLNKKLVENNIIPIFAVTQETISVYNKLSTLIQGARSAQLNRDSRNILALIKNIYQDITGTVQINHNAPLNLQLGITANCGNDVSADNGQACSSIPLGHEVTFDVEITARGCNADGLNNHSFNIYPIGLDEQLTVYADVYCDCSCEENQEQNSSVCTNGNGTLTCGICDCNEGRYGDYCECDGSILENTAGTSTCKPHNNTDVICSGRGECICGSCVCQSKNEEEGEEISGDFCECSNRNCPTYNEEICGGSERGECACEGGRVSKCKCKVGYTGQSCECPTSTDSCISPQNGLICNAKGNCTCGRCTCSSSKYWGDVCDKCVTEGCTECDLHVDCVKCHVFGEGLTEEQCEMCSQLIKTTDVLPKTEGNDTSFKECSYANEDKCTVFFSYSTTELNNTIVIYVNDKPQCSATKTKDFPLLPVIIGISLGIVLLGLLLIIIFRFYTWYLDKKEYEQLLKEQQNAKWQKAENPIYKQGIQTFQNPMYGKPIPKT